MYKDIYITDNIKLYEKKTKIPCMFYDFLVYDNEKVLSLRTF